MIRPFSKSIDNYTFKNSQLQKFLLVILCLHFSSFIFHLSNSIAQTGTWRAYMAYSEPQQIVKGGDRLYVRASNDLYSYSLTDQSITTYDKMRQLSDTYIRLIEWNPTVGKLLIIYQNNNIDLLSSDDQVFNISSYYNRTMTQDKTVNSVFMLQQYAFLCTAFGMVKLNMRKSEVTESYILNRNIMVAGLAGDSLYVQDNNGQVLSAKLTANLIDPHNWHDTTLVPAGVFDRSNADWDQYLSTVQSLQPGGPKYNTFGHMKFLNDRLYATGGSINYGTPTAIQILQDSEWTVYNNNIWEKTGCGAYQVCYSLDVDPFDANHLFLGTAVGLFEYQDGELKNFYNQANSPIESALNPKKYDENAQKNYNLVTAVKYDTNGNLWCLNSQAPASSVLLLKKGTQELTQCNVTDLMLFSDDGLKRKSLPWMMSAISDRQGDIWFVNNYFQYTSLHRFTPTDDGVQQHVSYSNFTNQDGTKTDIHYPRCIAQDHDDNIWMGTDQGIYYYDAAQQADPTQGYTQVKVPRNDGSDLADYLLANADVTCIAVDGANRKWIGTNGAGVYLVSADNMTEVQHFTTENSQLLDDIVESIAINPTTGDVFFGTSKGLCSYMSDATSAVEKMEKNDVYAFPNPVPPDYNGLITVRGLSMNADVRILTISGKLVAKGRSNGGTFTWNGRDLQNKRVASGIYMIATATSDGKRGVVAKVAVVK